MILRRRTDPKTRAPTLCEPAQAKCTPTCHKSHCVQTCAEEMLLAQKSNLHFVRACAIDMHAHFFTGGTLCKHVQVKCPGPEAGLRLCVSQSIRHSTCHKSSFFVPNLLEKRRATRPGCTPCATCPRTMLEIYKKCHATRPGRSLRVSLHNRHACQHFARCIYAEIYKSNAADHGEQL